MARQWARERSGRRFDCAELAGLERAVVRGNQDDLQQLFVILLENAFKYTPEGRQVRVSGQTSDETVEVTVADEGVGIEPDDLPHIFDRFYRAGGANRSDGHGLGLAIARQIAEQHRGTIGVSSVPGQGSRFTVTLPLAAATTLPPVGRAAVRAGPEEEGTR